MATAIVPVVGMASAKSVAAITRRRFRLLDVMILVAATAMACGLTLAMERITQGQLSWAAVPELLSGESGPFSGLSPTFFFIMATFLVTLLTLPFAVIWTLAMIPLRFISPRPRLRRIVRQPGAMALIAAGVGIAIAGIHVATVFFILGSGALGGSLLILVLMGGALSYPGLAVFVTWMTLLAGRRWRAEREWVDRLGRVFGAYWIAEAIALPVSYMFWVRIGG
jgi:hypothetical protein